MTTANLKNQYKSNNPEMFGNNTFYGFNKNDVMASYSGLINDIIWNTCWYGLEEGLKAFQDSLVEVR
jgi:hypothetical protein